MVYGSSLSFLAGDGSLAKGRGGRGGSGSSISDNWDAPGETKAAMAFQIIWFIFSLAQVYLLLTRLKGIPTWFSRGPYLLSTVITSILALAYLLWAIYTRNVANFEPSTRTGLSATINFFLDIDLAFRPAVVLYLLHVRGDILHASQGKTFYPVMAQMGKMFLDWALIGLIFILLIAHLGLVTSADQAFDSGRLSIYSYINKLNDAANLSHAIEAFQILLCLNIIISGTFLYIRIQSRKLTDPVVSRILFWTTPFFVILLISGLVLEIIPSTMSDYNPLAYNLASIMIEGFCSVGITAVIISTMNIAGVQWTKAPGPVTAPPMNQAGYPTNNGQPQPTWQPGMQPPQYQQGWQPQQQQTPYGSPPAGWQPQQQSTPYQIWNSQPAPNWQQPQQQPPPNMQYNPYSQPQTPPQQQQQQGYPQQQPQSMYGSPAPATYHTPSPGAPPPTHP